MEIVRTIEAERETFQYTYENLVDEFGDSLYKFCRSLAYSREEADDLFQETFYKAFEQMTKINSSDNPGAFLFSTCAFIWKGWKRKYARRNRLAAVVPLNESAACDEGMEDDYSAREEARIVRELVAGLPEKLKVPTILYYSVEMSVLDIALTLKLPVGTVKSRLFKARKLVEKGMNEYYEK